MVSYHKLLFGGALDFSGVCLVKTNSSFSGLNEMMVGSLKSGLGDSCDEEQ